MLSEYPLGCLSMGPCVGDSLYVYFHLGIGIKCVNLLEVWNCCIRCSVWVSRYGIFLEFAGGVLITLFSVVVAWFSIALYCIIEVCCCGAIVSVVVGPGLGRRWWSSWSVLIRLTHLEFVYGESVVVGVLLSSVFLGMFNT